MWAILRPLFYLWAALNAIDSISFGTRVARLVLGTIKAKFHVGGDTDDNDTALCQVCDDVMGDLLAGNDGLSAIPCRAACFRVPQCVQMCETVQQASETSVEFPCVVAGYCPKPDQEDESDVYDDLESLDELVLGSCQGAKWNPFQCHPSKYCHRKRIGIRWTCQVRPGRQRWTHLQRMAQQQTVALASSLVSQKHCSEPDAGPYCIARPQGGLAIVADLLGNLLALGMGAVQSVRAIQSPGGDDDRQWLIYWLILALVFFVEQYFARVVLSTCPLYYEGKCVAVLWLLLWGGADTCYRRLKKWLQDRNWMLRHTGMAHQELQRMTELLGDHICQQKDRIVQQVPLNSRASMTTLPSMQPGLSIRDFQNNTPTTDTTNGWSYDPDAETSDDFQAMKELFELSVFLLSSEGATLLSQSTPQYISKTTASLVLERAAACASFQPRYLHVTLVGTCPDHPVPIMDSNGFADPYVVCRLIPPSDDSGLEPYHGATSSTRYKTRNPQWNQERLEIPLRGGENDASGYYRSEVVGRTQLHVTMRDADVGVWSVLYHLCQVVTPLVCLLYWILPKLPARVRNHWNQVLPNDFRETWLWWIMVMACGAFVVTYVKAVVHRSDDDCVGECLVPLSILMDQGEHALLLPLRLPQSSSSSSSSSSSESNGDYQNGAGKADRGVLCVKLSLSET